MANTYSQIHLQCVFAVKFRAAIINIDWKDELEKYITAITQNAGHKMIAINSMPDHLHMFFGMRPSQSVSDLMELVKGDSSEWINRKRLTRSKFNWQSGYGVFSYSKKHIPIVAEYVVKQQEHHRKIEFRQEYLTLLKENGVEYDPRYVFKEMI